MEQSREGRRAVTSAVPASYKEESQVILYSALRAWEVDHLH